MNREEVIDLAMDIFENTDATMEEAMGVAIESAENKMSDAEKYRRRLLKAEGAATADARPGKYSGLSNEAPYHDKPEPRLVANVHVNGSGYGRADRLSQGGKYGKKGYMPRSYDGMSQREKNKIDRSVDRIVNKEHRSTIKQRKSYIKQNPTYSEFDKNRSYYRVYGRNGLGPEQTRTNYKNMKASKEAAIMDTALDFLDMYDVSLEEAIDMAYDYLID